VSTYVFARHAPSPSTPVHTLTGNFEFGEVHGKATEMCELTHTNSKCQIVYDGQFEKGTCVCLCIYMHVYLYMCIYMYIYVYMCVYMCIYVQIYVNMYVRQYAHVGIYIYIYVCIIYNIYKKRYIYLH